MPPTITASLVICLLFILHTSFSLPITSDVKVKLDSEQQIELIEPDEKKIQEVQVKGFSRFLGLSFDEGKVQELSEIRRTRREIMTISALCAEGMIKRICRCWTPEEFKKVFGDDELEDDGD